MKRFSKEIKNWPLHDDERLNLTYVETHGRDLSDFLANAMISLEDWHGNEGPAWELGDLSSEDFAAIEAMFVEYLAGA